MSKLWSKALCFLTAAVMLFGAVGCSEKEGDESRPGEQSSQTQTESGDISEMTGLKKDATILFMGDSITDGGRTDYSNKTFMGANHPKLFYDYMKKHFPDEKLTIYNTGVSGDTVLDQYFRLQEDCYDLNPDYIVMLLGVNDSWNFYKGKEVFEKSYRYLLDGITTNTDAKIILIQPYLFEPNEAMQKNCVIPDVGSYIPTVKEMGDVICRLAAEYKLDIIYLAEILEQQHQKGTSYQEMASDAIHPTQMTARIMLDQIMLKLGVKGYEPYFGTYDVSAIENQYK